MKKLFVVILLCFIKSALFAQTIQSVSPNYGYTGDNDLSITISGLNTNFSQGSSTIEFSQGSSTYFTGYNTQIQSATQLTTSINIPCYIDTGLYNLSVTNNGATVSESNAFTVYSPAIQSVTPDSASPGDVLSVQITGLNTDFTQASNTYIQFFNQASSTYITGYNNQVNSSTQLTTTIDVPCSPGLYNLIVEESNGCLQTLDSAFKVSTPIIQSVTPDSASEGDILSVQIAGLNTNFTQGSGTYIQFNQGTSTYFTGYNALINSTTQLTTSINIPCSSNPGLYNLLVESGGCFVIQDSAFKVSLGPCNNFSVWPGDANEDLVVNNFDLLPIGLYYGDIGTARDTTTIAWESHPAIDWDSLQANGYNRKFVDCNGDGVINSDDTLAVVQNYNLTHPLDAPHSSSERTAGTVPFSIVTDSSSYHAGSTIHATILLGNSTDPATNLYGLAYNISLNTSIIQQGSIVYNYNNESFLGSKNVNALVITKLDNDIETAVTGIDHTNKSGFGDIADLYFKLTNSSTLSQLGLSISAYEAIDAQGNQISLLTGINRVSANSEQLSIYPNPTNGEIAVNISPSVGEIKDWYLQITDVLGRTIYTRQSLNYNNDIDLSNLSSGVYFITVTNKTGKTLVPVVKQ